MIYIFSIFYCSKVFFSIRYFQVSHPVSLLQINVKIKIVSGSPCGAVAAEAKRAQASWVVLDKYILFPFLFHIQRQFISSYA